MPSQRDRIRMTEAEVEAFLAERTKLHVATVNRDGSPHLMPMYFLAEGTTVVFWTFTKSQKIRNLERDPRITVMAEDGGAYFDLRGVQIAGIAHLAAGPEATRPFGERLYARRLGAIDDAAREQVARQAAKRTVVTVEPRRIASWDHRKLLSDGA